MFLVFPLPKDRERLTGVRNGLWIPWYRDGDRVGTSGVCETVAAVDLLECLVELLDDIIDYIATQEGLDAAVKVYDKFKKRTQTLSIHPKRCRIVPELRSVGVMEYRELIVSPYRVFFRIDENDVEIWKRR